MNIVEETPRFFVAEKIRICYTNTTEKYLRLEYQRKVQGGYTGEISYAFGF